MIGSHTMRLFGAALVLGLTATFAEAQAPDAPQRDLEKDVAILRERKRPVLHPGRPLELVGNEQEENGFRARVPGLASVERRSVAVDADENYARRLTMFNRGGRYTTPLAAPSAGAGGSRAHPVRPAPEGTAPRVLDRALEAPAPQGFHPIWWILAAAAVAWTAVRALRARGAASVPST